MINSLSKDSHITQYHRFYNSGYDSNQKNTGTNASKSATVINQDILVKKPAEISFSGFLDAKSILENFSKQTIELPKSVKLIISEESKFAQLVENAKQIIDPNKEIKNNKVLYKKVATLINDSIKAKKNPSTELNAITQKFLTENDENINALIKNSDIIVKPKEDEVKKLTQTELTEKIDKARIELIEDSNNVIATLENEKSAKKGTFFSSTKVQNILKKAEDTPIIFSALFSLILTGIFRPASIMVLPGQKKNKDDKKYAAAHSVASGVIGYCISLLIFAPLGHAIKSIGNNPEKYLGKKITDDYLGNSGKEFLDKIKDKLAKEYQSVEKQTSEFEKFKINRLKASGNFNLAKKIINMFPEVVLAPPKAILTIALIPPILKYIFGWEKKKQNVSNKDTNNNMQSLNLKIDDANNKSKALLNGAQK